MRVWHRRLIEGLTAAGHTVRLDPIQTRRKTSRWVSAILLAERYLYGARSSLFAETVSPFHIEPGHNTDATIVLAGRVPDAGLSIEPLFDGKRGESAMLEALLAHRSPMVAIEARQGGEVRKLESAHPAIESPDVLARSLDHVLLRLVSLLVRAVADVAGNARAIPSADPSGSTPGVASPAAFLARGFFRAVKRKWGPAKGRPSHWQIAARAARTAASSFAWSRSEIDTLLDHEAHFYADPFPFEHGDRRLIFFEDFPYATGKGVIAAVEIDAAGNAGASRTVLETPIHLSYPFVLEHGDHIYMLPEMSGARLVQLFRADPFPDRWLPDKVLIQDAIVGDATPIWHDGRYWIFASVADDGGSTWDQLALYHAPDLLGPWVPHPGNPVLIDAGAARPAGAMWHENGTLMRVAQDCRTGYGIGLAICRVDRLDDEGYVQTVVRRIGPPNGFGADGIHTYNRSQTLEVIDLRISHSARSAG